MWDSILRCNFAFAFQNNVEIQAYQNMANWYTLRVQEIIVIAADYASDKVNEIGERNEKGIKASTIKKEKDEKIDEMK